MKPYNPKQNSPAPPIVHEGDQPAYSEDGVDLTLIRWMLSLTPTERLQQLQQHINMLLRLRGDQDPY